MCHAKEESAMHYLLDCFLYTTECQTLFSLDEYLIPKFLNLSKATKYIILLYGYNNDNPNYNCLNFRITIAVQNFIIQTKRFSKH